MQRTTKLKQYMDTTLGLRPWPESVQFCNPIPPGFEEFILTGAQILEVCYKCGVKVVTVYAFSLENFNRPEAEVKGLMALAKSKLKQLVDHGELLERYDARIRICGKQELIPDDVMEIMNQAVEATSKNNGFVF